MSVEINATNFPDEKIRSYISDYFDLDNDDVLSEEELQNATRMNIYESKYSGVSDLTGLSLLPYLQSFRLCNTSYITSINLATIFYHNPGFEFYIEEVTNLVNINAANCDWIKTIGISDTESIESIDVSGCTNLEKLNFRVLNSSSTYPTEHYSLTSLNVNGCTKLKELYVTNQSLTSVDISTCPNIETLDLSWNLLTHLDISPLTKLKTLLAKRNELVSIDLGSISSLETLNVSINFLNALRIPRNQHLSILTCWENNFNTLDISRCEQLLLAYEPYKNRQGVPVATISLTGSRRNVQPAYYRGSVNNYILVDRTVNIISDPEENTISIQTQPTNQVIRENETATFRVVATGNNLIYQWEKYDGVKFWEALQGETGNTLSVSWNDFEHPEETGVLSYRCNISNLDSTIYTNAVTLTLLSNPTITTNPSSASVTDGTKHTFSVVATGNDLTYQWQSSTNGSTWSDIRYATGRSYEIQASLGMTGMQYRCVVTNSVGSATSNAATLTVIADQSLAPPEVSIHPVDTTVNEGSTATFSAAATGEELSYQWQTLKNGQWTTITGATGTSYSVAGSRLLNGAQYRCQISNASGSVYTDTATLSVTLAPTVTTPVITTQPHSIMVRTGNSATFTCRATGGDLNYQWQIKQNGSWYDITGETNTVYSFQANQNDNGKQVRCFVENSAGSIYSNVATLTVPASAPLTFYGYHSIIISGKNTYGEWEMYPTSRPHVAPPEVKTSYVDVPGADGGLDYTDLLTGQAQYGYRKGSWEFLLIPGVRWAEVYRSLCSYLHGKVHTVVLEDDPTWEYTGRLSVNEWKSAAHNSLITIDYILDPNPVNTDGETYDSDETDLQAAARVLRKPGNEGCVIKLINGAATVVEETSLFPDGDSIAY